MQQTNAKRKVSFWPSENEEKKIILFGKTTTFHTLAVKKAMSKVALYVGFNNVGGVAGQIASSIASLPHFFYSFLKSLAKKRQQRQFTVNPGAILANTVSLQYNPKGELAGKSASVTVWLKIPSSDNAHNAESIDSRPIKTLTSAGGE